MVSVGQKGHCGSAHRRPGRTTTQQFKTGALGRVLTPTLIMPRNFCYGCRYDGDCYGARTLSWECFVWLWSHSLQNTPCFRNTALWVNGQSAGPMTVRDHSHRIAYLIGPYNSTLIFISPKLHLRWSCDGVVRSAWTVWEVGVTPSDNYLHEL